MTLLLNRNEGIYHDLDNARHEIRLLRYSGAASTNGYLHYNLVTASLNDSMQYDALSYCWGIEGDKETIVVDDKRTLVSRNLKEALGSLCSQTHDLIWADAICINQANDFERSTQVRLMGHIYSRARFVIAWLGSAAQHTAEAAKLVEGFCDSKAFAETEKQKQYMTRLVSNSDAQLLDFFRDNDLVEYWFSHNVRKLDHPQAALAGLREILTRQYWQRVWIIQEVAKAAVIRAHCGPFRLQLDALLMVMPCVKGMLEHNEVLLYTISRFREQELSCKGDRSSRVSLYEALISTRFSHSTDPRDKVYSLLGLTSDGDDLVPTPSYSRPVHRVFEDVSVAILSSRRGNNMLALSQWASLRRSNRDRHSWAIDWTATAYNTPPWLATKVEWSYVPSPPNIVSAEDVIRVSGTHLATLDDYEYDKYQAHSALSMAPSPDPTRVLAEFCLDICHRFGHGLELQELDDGADTIVDSFAYLIKAARYLTPVEDIRLGHQRYALECLGNVELGRYQVWNWVNRHDTRQQQNSSRGSGLLPHFRPSARASCSRSNAAQFRETAPTEPRNKLLLSYVDMWKRIVARIDCGSEFPLRYLTSHHRHLVVLHQNAQFRDVIYEVQGSGLPLVLRRLHDDTFMLIGEACLGVDAEGAWVSAIHAPYARLKSKEMVIAIKMA